MESQTTENTLTGFDGYTIVTDLEDARDIMCYALSSYFDTKNKYKYGKEYIKYTVWIQKNTNPSHKSVYNFIKHNTTLSEPQKYILFTLTNKQVFYRFKNTYYEPLVAQRTPKTPNVSTKEKSTPLPLIVTENNLESQPNPEIPETINVENSTQNATEKPTDTTTESYDTLKTIIKNVHENIDDGMKSSSQQSPLTSSNDLSNKMEKIFANVEKQLENLNDKLSNFMETTNRNISTITSNVHEKIETITAQTNTKIAELDAAKEDYRVACDKIKSRTNFVEKQINLIERKLNFVDNDLDTIMDRKLDQHITDNTVKFNDKVEEAEQDVTATLLSFKHHADLATKQVIPPQDSTTNKPTESEANELIETMRLRTKELNALTEKWTFQQADRDLDTLLVSKLKDFDDNTTEQMNALQQLQEDTKRILSARSQRTSPDHNTAPYRESPQASFPHAHQQSAHTPDRSHTSFNTTPHVHHANRGETKTNFFQRYGQTTPEKISPTYDRPGKSGTYEDSTRPAFHSYRTRDARHDNIHAHNDHPQHSYDTNLPYKPYEQQHNVFRVNSEYLRKNVKISCTDDSTLLEFYMKLRISVQKGGIFLTNLENITVDKPIFEIKANMQHSDYEAQSNALFAILSNEDVIPTDYVHAINCIAAKNDSMDGFGALKNMLMTVHPSLTKTPPPKVPPTLSEYTDLHTYDQALRNFYLKNYLYTGFKHSDVEKSEQFVKGLNTNEYTHAKQRIINQIDNVKLYGGDMPHQFRIENLSGTVLNMSEYQPKTNAQVNMLQRTYTDRQKTNFQRQPVHNNNRKTSYTKVQCGACKTFGHKAADCNIAGKILAVNHLQSKNPELCKQLLATHTSKNKPEKRLAIIKQLQQVQFIDDNVDAEEYLLDENINQTIDVTLNAVDTTLTLDDINDKSD